MTRDELEALVERDERDLLDILKATSDGVPHDDALTLMLMQMQMLSRFNYWTADLIAAFLGGWESEALDDGRKFDA